MHTPHHTSTTPKTNTKNNHHQKRARAMHTPHHTFGRFKDDGGLLASVCVVKRVRDSYMQVAAYTTPVRREYYDGSTLAKTSIASAAV
jgi:hypothetical protein